MHIVDSQSGQLEPVLNAHRRLLETPSVTCGLSETPSFHHLPCSSPFLFLFTACDFWMDAGHLAEHIAATLDINFRLRVVIVSVSFWD